MSSRALRRLLENNKSNAFVDEESEEEQQSVNLDDAEPERKSFNLFSMLTDENEQESLTDEMSANEDMNEASSVANDSVKQPQLFKPVKKHSKKNKNAKNKSQTPIIANPKTIPNGSDEECEKLKSEPKHSKDQSMSDDIELIVTLDKKFFDFDRELKQLYGPSCSQINSELMSSSLEREQGLSGRMRKRVQKHSKSIGTSVRHLKYDLLSHLPVEFYRAQTASADIYLHTDSSSKKGGLVNGYFFHGSTYQSIEFDFFEALSHHSPEPIQQLLLKSPHHLNSLMVLSDICQHMGQYPIAFNCIKKSIYVIETAIRRHKDTPNWTLMGRGWSHRRLPYHVYENRAVYGSIYRMIDLVGRQGAWRAALEFAILLWSLEPETDPLGVLYWIDLLALRSKQFSFLSKTYPLLWAKSNAEYDEPRPFPPTYYYSLAWSNFQSYLDSLVLKHKCITSEAKEDLKMIATVLLKDAILNYPLFVDLLMDNGIIQANSVSSSLWDSLNTKVQFLKENSSHPLYLLGLLYMERASDLWKIPDVNQWLRETLKQMANDEDFDLASSTLDEVEMSHWHQENPRLINLYRHLSLLHGHHIKFPHPYAYRNVSFHKHDPFPPLPSSYSTKAYEEFFEKENDHGILRQRPALENRLREGVTDSLNQLTNWLRSMWRNNPDPPLVPLEQDEERSNSDVTDTDAFDDEADEERR